MSALAYSQPLPLAQALAEECLTAMQWCDLLKISPQAFRKRGPVTRSEVIEGKILQVFPFGGLPTDYRTQLDTLRQKHLAPSFTALIEMRKVETRKWESPKGWLDYEPSTRKRAEIWQGTLAVYYQCIDAGLNKTDSNRRARHHYENLTGRSVSDKQVTRWVKRIDERGREMAPLTAYCDDKECPHVAARKEVPEDFLSAVRSKALEPGVSTMAAAVRFFELEWREGRAVPGLGRAPAISAPFPYTAKQLGDRRLLPSKAARVQASHGKAAAMSRGFVAAPPIGTSTLRLRERIVFDDKRLDLDVQDDITGNPITVTLYLAMDEGTREILGYLLREDGAVRQTDVEGLTAFILRVAGFAGRTAGYATTLKFERGTVAISEARQALLQRLFPGEIIISRTTMNGGHNATGDYAQQSTGHYHGKLKLESFMKTLDEYTRHIPGQRGNVYKNQPLMLGDTLLTAEKIASPNYKLKGTMIEEAVIAAQMAQAVHFADTGELPGAAAASTATGVRGPLIYLSELHTAVQSVIAYYNAQRGHSREGFIDVPMIMPNGVMRKVRESSNDKAARLAAELTAQGKCLQKISEKDAAILLHKAKHVTVTAKHGVKTSINGVQRWYWSENSLACAEAARLQGGEKDYIALYNPEDPRDLYLLRNAVGHIPRTATALPAGEEPHFFEALPLYDLPEINDPAAQAERKRRTAAAHGRVGVEITRTIVPFTNTVQEQRQRNLDQTEPLRAAVAVLHDQAPKVERPTSALGEEITVMAAERGEPGEPIPTPEGYASGLPFAQAQDDEC